ncbi:Helix-turn-helix domain protein [Tsuneonella dongtanensis]|uniref:Helix-turn-helix domain protein n=1 Tax=Tsuneonella dongtanensis TaxID=692370 RepID=A0A1B2AAC2_9SPHN|nr:helix-turn-helix domain-containing protein [Tsuneonella dongtanensis]ANY19109.1 Helix-turn-helix domain protein [Tsuneonella dongtanensis]
MRDQVYPEWANIRLTSDGAMAACTGPGPLQACGPICGIGPTSRATHFELSPGRYWTISLLPLGWARLMQVPARAFADRWEVIGESSAFARFAPLLELAATDDPKEAVARFDACLVSLFGARKVDEAAIVRAHSVLLDPEVPSVNAFADQAGLSVRQLERLANSAFGFTPKLLLRRQRFLRSLAKFMLDPSLAWVDTLDSQYVDQAHFIRDFRRFMDETPGSYASRSHPVLWAAAHARSAAAGTAMQVLQHPVAAGQGIAIERTRP